VRGDDGGGVIAAGLDLASADSFPSFLVPFGLGLLSPFLLRLIGDELISLFFLASVVCYLGVCNCLIILDRGPFGKPIFSKSSSEKA